LVNAEDLTSTAEPEQAVSGTARVNADESDQVFIN
jgi:hypothetical protein